MLPIVNLNSWKFTNARSDSNAIGFVFVINLSVNSIASNSQLRMLSREQ